MNKKEMLKQDAEVTVDCAIGYVKSSPCAICRAEMPDYSCWYDVKYKATCPVYKELKKRLSVL